MLILLVATALGGFAGALVLGWLLPLPSALHAHFALAIGVMPLIMGAMLHFAPVLPDLKDGRAGVDRAQAGECVGVTECRATAQPALDDRTDEGVSMGSPKTRSVAEIRGALEHCYDAFDALCADLSDTEWQTQSLCPDWTMPHCPTIKWWNPYANWC